MLKRNARLVGTLGLALVLALFAAHPGAAAVGSPGARAAAAPGIGLFESIRLWLAAWWVGPEMDPDGAAATRRAGPARRVVNAADDVGPGMDPNGRATTKSGGAGAHPSGSANTDVGPDIDPNGR
jgi:hypothetical protein